jgi:Tol biopolymer transport system component
VSDQERPRDPAPSPAAAGRLDSWKEIAAYLKRDVTTVRRWEKREGLPVHRHRHEQRESVYAFASELESWWQSRRGALVNNNGTADETAANGVAVARSTGPVVARLAIPAAALAVGALLSLAVSRLWLDDRPPDSEYRLAIFPPDDTSFGAVSLSPDGLLLAFTAVDTEGVSRLFVRPLDTLSAKPLPGTEDAAFPFWAPSSNTLAFFARGKLRAIELSGGSPRIIADASDGRGGTWNRQGFIVFTPDRESALARVPAVGGEAVPVSTLADGERGHLWPEFLPDGDHFLYLADSSQAELHNLFVGSLSSAERTPLVPLLLSNAAYARGRIFFARDRQLLAAPFDVDRLRLTGEPIVVGDDVLQQWDLDHKADFSVSENGVIIFRSLRGPDTHLVWRDRAERRSTVTSAPAHHFEPTLSPDQQQIAVDVFDPRPSKQHGFGAAHVTSDIWLMNREGGEPSRLTFHPAADFDPVWSPDGASIAFSSNRRGRLDLYRRDLHRAAGDEVLLASQEDKHAQDWSPDGRWIVYATYNPNTREDLWLLPADGGGEPVLLLGGEASEIQAQVAPDGRWFAYVSNESGRDEVYVQSFPAPAGKWQVSSGGGGDPRWRADGRELFYIGEDRRLMSVSVTAGDSFKAGRPAPLFDTGMKPQWGAARNLYDVSTDGQQFLFMTPVADDRPSPFTLLLNWRAGAPK